MRISAPLTAQIVNCSKRCLIFNLWRREIIYSRLESFRKLLGELHNWEIAIWEIVTWEVAPRKIPNTV